MEADPFTLPPLPAVLASRAEPSGEAFPAARQLEAALPLVFGFLESEDQPAAAYLPFEATRCGHVTVLAADRSAILGEFHRPKGRQPFAGKGAHPISLLSGAPVHLQTA